MTPRKPFTMEPNIEGSTLRLVTYELPKNDPDLTDLPALLAEVDGEVCGYIMDRQRPELVTLQVAQGHPDHDLRWARRNLVDGFAVSRTVLEEHADGGASYHGTASRNVDDPTRYEFCLTFGKGAA